MKLSKRLASLLLTAALLLGLAACGGGGGTEPTGTGDPAGNVSGEEGEIVVNVSDNVTLINLEVYANNNSCEFLYADLVFDPLYYGDRQGNVSPCICTVMNSTRTGQRRPSILRRVSSSTMEPI